MMPDHRPCVGGRAAGRARRPARGQPRARRDAWQTVRRVVLPTARAGLATALILGVARGVGETALVLITSGASTFLKINPFELE